MKICILGGRGMLGHKMYEVLSQAFDEVSLTIQGSAAQNAEVLARFGRNPVIAEFDAMHPEHCAEQLRELQPEVVVNCIGVVKQRAESADPIKMITVNGLFPHYLASAAAEWNGRVIHFSTDCVFSGRKGNYTENDLSDVSNDDLYGRSKLIGEPHGKNVLTLRTSMIGPEIAHKKSFLEWFLQEARDGRAVKGYRRVVFSGLTTLRLAQITIRLIRDFSGLSGLYHVAGEAISKHNLLLKLREAYDLDVQISADDEFVIDRSLDSSCFERATRMERPIWKEMIAEMAEGVAV
jgi:dTDP-4-dehydrorhamnose reductase